MSGAKRTTSQEANWSKSDPFDGDAGDRSNGL
jgi:hypothetical protein